MNTPIVIVSRESRLAMWQAQYVQMLLKKAHPQLEFQILGTTTKGDEILNQPLSTIGGKGLFIKELEVAIQTGQAQLAVHSMKDVPMELPEGFLLPIIFGRENPLDAFVSNQFESLSDMPADAIVGTSSLRREAQLRRHFPHLKIKSLRGNLDTRLKKLDNGDFDAIILASAGLIRLGLKNRIRAILSPEESLPAPGQGALGVEILANAENTASIMALLKPLIDEKTATCVVAERAVSRILGGSCQVPLGAFAELSGDNLFLRAFVASVDGQSFLRAEMAGDKKDAEHLGENVAHQLLENGADEILKKIVR